MKSSVDDLLEKRLLRRTPKSKEKALESFNAAGYWLVESENNLKTGSLRSSVLTAYLAMFHAARSVLYADGFREKSHYAVARYLEEECVAKGSLERKWVDLLDSCRETRHEDQYAVHFTVTEEDATKMLAAAKQFVERMKKLLDTRLK